MIFSRLGFGEARSGVEQVKDQKQVHDDDKGEQASFRPHRSPGKPGRPVEGRIQQAPRSDHAAVRNSIEKGFRIIPQGMQTNGEPEIAGPPHREAEKKADQGGGKPSGPVLSGVAKVKSTERERKQNCRRPESHASGQSEKYITAKKELFKETDC